MDYLLSKGVSNLFSLDTAMYLWQNMNVYQMFIDVFLVVIAAYVFFRKPVKPEKPLSEEEIEEIIQEWEPEPLFPEPTEFLTLDDKLPSIERSTRTEVVIDGKTILHFSRTNFTGMINDPDVEESALKALYKYGTGTCGPRGFYGTIDIHLDLERRINSFMNTEDCLIYSFGFATVASAIPAFAGRGDLLIVDKGVNYSIQTGVKLSRSEVIWFNHNDMADLERVMQSVRAKDNATKRQITRRFVVVEGFYYNFGDLAPLPKIMELKDKYCYRLIMDDSFGIGSIGKTGRGTCEYFNVKPRDVEILTGNLEGTTSSIGGFCCASRQIVYHQRLNSSGYVYSASLPPLLAAASITALDKMDQQPQLFTDLSVNVEKTYSQLSQIEGLTITSLPLSHLIHLQLTSPTGDRFQDETILQEIVDERGVLITRAKYSLNHESFLPPPSIRVTVSAINSSDEIERATKAIREAAQVVFGRLPSFPAKEDNQASGLTKRQVN